MDWMDEDDEMNWTGPMDMGDNYDDCGGDYNGAVTVAATLSAAAVTTTGW